MTGSYYESLCLKFRFEECQSIESETIKCFSKKSLSPALDNADDDVSSHNKSSIIFTFESETGKEYLFMGDANKESFDNIPELLKERYAKDVFWLKVSHHGSERNLDSEMIKFINQKLLMFQRKTLNTIYQGEDGKCFVKNRMQALFNS